MANHDFDINEHNSEEYYGLCFSDGVYQELLKYPNKKPGLEFNWPDQHGMQVDNGVNYYESRALSLPVFIAADSEEALLLKYKNFGDVVKSGIPITLDSYFLNRRFTLRYVSTSDVVWSETVVSFTLNLVDDFPVTNTPIP